MSHSSSSRPLWFWRSIFSGDFGPDVQVVQRKLGLEPTGWYDRSTMERVIGMARKQNIRTNGEVNEDVAVALGESEANKSGLTPQWYVESFGPADLFSKSGPDVRAVRVILGLGGNDDRYDPDLEAAVRRFQSQHDRHPDGIVDEDLAKILGE
jgi:peptidoglycan hydrolase-like protein with peptidoglycan-binding domain